MLKYLIILLIGVFILNLSVYGQDIDFFLKNKNDNFKMPEIDKNMTFEEFQFLSRELRMKHMLYSAIVPGYVHFYVHENKTAYSILGTRLVGYGGLAYVLIKNGNDIGLKDLVLLNFNKSSFSDEEAKKYSAISYTSLALIFGSYFFDWIRGQQILQKKQEKIRFKYSIKLQSFNTFNSNRFVTVPAAGISVSF